MADLRIDVVRPSRQNNDPAAGGTRLIDDTPALGLYVLHPPVIRRIGRAGRRAHLALRDIREHGRQRAVDLFRKFLRAVHSDMRIQKVHVRRV